MAKIEYRKEFFDREYSGWESYRRVWKYARKYRFRLLIGIVCGMSLGSIIGFAYVNYYLERHKSYFKQDV